MDYINPEHRRLREEPTKPLSPEEAEIAAKQYQAWVLKTLNDTIAKAFLDTKISDIISPSTTNKPNTNEEENRNRFN